MAGGKWQAENDKRKLLNATITWRFRMHLAGLGSFSLSGTHGC